MQTKKELIEPIPKKVLFRRKLIEYRKKRV